MDLARQVLRSYIAAGGAVLALLSLLPAAGAAQEVSGQARAIQATVLGMGTALADTGTLNGPEDAREAAQLAGSIASLGGAEVLHAAAISSIDGWDALDYVAAEASLANLALNIAGNSISAAFVMAEALAPVGGANSGSTGIDGLQINGVPIAVTGIPNQTIALPGGRVIINEQQASQSGGMVVNALHIVVNNVADVVLASASAGVTPGTTSADLPSLPGGGLSAPLATTVPAVGPVLAP